METRVPSGAGPTPSARAFRPLLGGARFLGVVVGAELRHLRAVGPAIAAIDWAAHDEPLVPLELPDLVSDDEGDLSETDEEGEEA